MTRRSVLFSPGDRPEMLRKAPESGADVVVFDLEDGVAPEQKATARECVNDVLGEIDPDCEVCVRVNPGQIETDLEAVLTDSPRLDSVLLPKVGGPEDIGALVDVLAGFGVDCRIFALVESAAGVLDAEAIARAEGTDALLFGAEDLAADVGAIRSPEGSELLYARQHVVLAASAADVDAIDTLVTNFEDTDRLRADTLRGMEMGYDGKMAIHPRQVSVINEAFTPTSERIEWAERVLEAHEHAETEGRGVFAVDGEMIDAPLLAQARRVLERARAAEKR